MATKRTITKEELNAKLSQIDFSKVSKEYVLSDMKKELAAARAFCLSGIDNLTGLLSKVDNAEWMNVMLVDAVHRVDIVIAWLDSTLAKYPITDKE